MKTLHSKSTQLKRKNNEFDKLTTLITSVLITITVLCVIGMII